MLRLRGLNGEPEQQDVRGLPFLKFEDNESHTEGLYSFNFGDDKNGEVHGDREHPFIVRRLRAWETHYVLRPNVQFFLCEDLKVQNAVYGVYHPDYDAHVYRDLDFDNVMSEPINRGHDDESIQYGDFTYERLTLRNCRTGRDPLIQMACTAPKPGVKGFFKDLRIENCRSQTHVVDLGGGPRNDKLEHAVRYYFLTGDDCTPLGITEQLNGDVVVASRKFPDELKDHGYGGGMAGWTGPDVVLSVLKRLEFPQLLAPRDDLPPATFITRIRRDGDKLHVSGVAHDDSTVAVVSINNSAAKITSQQAGVAEWEITIPAVTKLEALARDAAGNEERSPHRITDH